MQLEFEEERDFAAAKEYEQIYGIVMDLLDKIVDLLGDEQFDITEYADVLDAGFEAAKVGVIPPGYDCVVLGDIERTRLDDIRVLFFAGVNDGIIPKAAAAGGILSGFDREHLLEKDIQLAPTPRERAFIQKFYLYLNMTKPKRTFNSKLFPRGFGRKSDTSILSDRTDQKNVSTDQSTGSI